MLTGTSQRSTMEHYGYPPLKPPPFLGTNLMDNETLLMFGLAFVALTGGWLFIRAYRKLRWLD